MNRSAKSNAMVWADWFRRHGYPEAEAALEYCLEGELGPDGFWTYTVSIYLGPYVEPLPWRRRLYKFFFSERT